MLDAASLPLLDPAQIDLICNAARHKKLNKLPVDSSFIAAAKELCELRTLE